MGSSWGAELHIVNDTPSIRAGGTIWDKHGGLTVTVFGFQCPAAGCVIPHGASASFQVSMPAEQFGAQWDISRMSSDGVTYVPTRDAWARAHHPRSLQV